MLNVINKRNNCFSRIMRILIMWINEMKSCLVVGQAFVSNNTVYKRKILWHHFLIGFLVVAPWSRRGDCIYQSPSGFMINNVFIPSVEWQMKRLPCLFIWPTIQHVFLDIERTNDFVYLNILWGGLQEYGMVQCHLILVDIGFHKTDSFPQRPDVGV